MGSPLFSTEIFMFSKYTKIKEITFFRTNNRHFPTLFRTNILKFAKIPNIRLPSYSRAMTYGKWKNAKI